MAAIAAGPFASPMAAMNPPRPMIAQRLLRGRREASDGRPARTQPAADQSREQGAAGAAQRHSERPDLQAEQSDQQACRNSRREEGDIGPVTIAQHLADFRRGAFDVVRCADQRHDVAEIDPGFRGERNFLSSARQIPQEHAARGIADPIGDFGQGPAVQRLIVDEDAERIAQDLAQHLGAFDLRADRGTGPDEGRCRSGKDDFIAAFENRRPCAVDVAAVADNAFDDDTVADTIFDCANRLSGGGDDPVGPRLEFLVAEASGLAGLAAGKARLQLGGFFLEVDAHQPGRGKGHKQQRQDVTENVGDGITRGDIGLLLAQDIVGKTELCQRARRRSDHG